MAALDGVCYPDTTDWTCAYPDNEDGSPNETLDAMDPMVRARAEALAWRTIATLTAYQVAPCPITVRPCRRGCNTAVTYYESRVTSGGQTGGTFNPVLSGGVWTNTCGCTSDPCSCGQMCEIFLPGPVGGIVDVTLNGAVLDPTAYRVDNGDRLVRQDGECWPPCQDMNAQIGTDNTWSVTYYMGAAPDGLTNWIAGLLAVEYAKACTGGKCRLPSGVTMVTRQGVTLELQTGMFPNGATGIREVDAWLAGINPYGLKQPPRISSPDYRPSRITTMGW